MKKTNVNKTRTPIDLPESKDDKKHLESDEATFDLPDVRDIPGQEHVRPLPPGEMADTTISSADEEGNNILNTDEDIITDQRSNVSPIEKELLQQSSESMASKDDEQLKHAAVDNSDDDDTALNERVNRSGSDLDVPGSEDDDMNEEIGEEDEENNYYSLRDPEDEQE
jgi:hypothetical protein